MTWDQIARHAPHCVSQCGHDLPPVSIFDGPTDQECPRCHGKGLGARPDPTAPQTQPLGAGAPPFNPAQPQYQQPDYQQPNYPPQGFQAPAASDDGPSFLMGLIGFIIPLVGLILFLVDKASRPRRARSAGIGALAGFVCQLLLVPTMVAATLFPVFSRAKSNAERSECQSHMRQLSLAAMMFGQDHNDRFPDMSTPASIERDLMPYAHSKNTFTCPAGHVYYGNPAMSGKSMSQINSPATEVLFYESDNAHLEGSNVAYADGHIKWLRESQWEALKQSSGIR